MGLVVGLKGTGDGGDFMPAIRSLAVALQLMANPVGKTGPLELKNAKNVALVMVTVTIPGAGGRQGGTSSTARSTRSARPRASTAGRCS